MKTIPIFMITMLVVACCGIPLGAQAPSLTKPQAVTTPTYQDELDQKQEIASTDIFLPIGHLPIPLTDYNVQVAQSFVPTKEVLTRVELDLAKNATTSIPLTVALRSSLSGSDLAEVSIPAVQIPVSNASWVDCNLPDSWVVPGQTYYIVCTTDDVDGNLFGWTACNDSTSYASGCAWYSTDGVNWNSTSESAPAIQQSQPYSQPKASGNGTWDMCFRTYGLSEATLTYKPTMFGITVTNTGNITAQDFWWNISIIGGIFGLVNYHNNGTITELAPGDSVTLKLGPVFGLGSIMITIQVGGANVRTAESTKNAKIFLFFIHGIN